MTQFAFINMEYIEQVSKGNVTFIIEMVNMFTYNTPGILNEIKDAMQNKDWNQVGFLAHKLKATYAYMGMEELRELLIFMEKSAKQMENLSQLQEVFEMLVDKTKDGVVELERYKSGLENSTC